MSKRSVQVYTERESFAAPKFPDFHIASYFDTEPEHLKRVEPHRHTYYEIIWVKKGTGIHKIDFTDYKFQGPCLFLLHPQNVHTLIKENATSGGVIKFSPTFLSAKHESKDFLNNCGVFDDINVLPVIKLEKTECEQLSKIFSEMKAEYSSDGSFTPIVLANYLTIFLLKVCEIKNRATRGPLKQGPALIRFRRFQEKLEGNFKQHHNVLFYSESLNVSVRTLGNLTRLIMGKSPQELIKERLLLESKRLLYHSELSMKEIADLLGFQDDAYFIRFFKKNASVSPGHFRKTKM